MVFQEKDLRVIGEPPCKDLDISILLQYYCLMRLRLTLFAPSEPEPVSRKPRPLERASGKALGFL